MKTRLPATRRLHRVSLILAVVCVAMAIVASQSPAIMYTPGPVPSAAYVASVTARPSGIPAPGPGAAAAVPPPPAMVYSTPAGCQPITDAYGNTYLNCAGVYYTPYYYGPQLVYVNVPAPR